MIDPLRHAWGLLFPLEHEYSFEPGSYAAGPDWATSDFSVALEIDEEGREAPQLAQIDGAELANDDGDGARAFDQGNGSSIQGSGQVSSAGDAAAGFAALMGSATQSQTATSSHQSNSSGGLSGPATASATAAGAAYAPHLGAHDGVAAPSSSFEEPVASSESGTPGVESGTGNLTQAYTLTGTNTIDSLWTAVGWADGTINYSFPSSTAVYSYSTFDGGFGALNAQQETAAHFALNDGVGTLAARGFSVEGFTNLNIVYDSTPDTDQIRLANTSSTNVSTARVADFPANYLSGTLDDNGDVWFGGSGDFPDPGDYDWHTVIHEIGHALGLEHPHDNFDGDTLNSSWDGMEFTVMSYRSFIGQSINADYSNETWGYAQTWMMLDIRALQELYGADFTTNGGDTVYTWDPLTGQSFVDGSLAISPGDNSPDGNRIFQTIWDGNGEDTYDLADYSSDLSIDLSPGGYSIFDPSQLADLGGGPNNGHARGNVFNALQYNNDPRSLIENAIGGTGHDTISGNQASNTLHGGAGNDELRGGHGQDELRGGTGRDILRGGSAEDRLFGGGASDEVYGGSSADFLRGQSGDDQLFGGGGSDDMHGNLGADILRGGGGGDLLVGGWGGDQLFGGGGSDDMHGKGGADILRGGGGDDLLFGGGRDDRLFGGADDDQLFGGGGSDDMRGNGGADILRGGGGGDQLFGGWGGDQLFGGADDDQLFGGGGSDDMRGNGGADILRGGGGGDQLFGGWGGDQLFGGGGSDDMRGGGGADILRGAHGDDRLFGGGNGDVLRGGSGHDVLRGNGGNDRLFGGGDNDRLIGGLGNDRLVGNAGADAFVFQPNGSDDVVVDFQNNVDWLDFSAFNFANEASVLNLATQVGADVVFGLAGGASVELSNFDLNLLGAGDILI